MRSSAKSKLAARLVLILITLLLSFQFRPSNALARSKSFWHPDIDITYILHEDGSAEVDEIRSFKFRGRFSWAQIEKSTAGDYGRYDIRFLEVTDADTGEKCRMETSSSGDIARVKWHYSAKNETKRFLIRYRIKNAVQRYSDAAQFYFKATGRKSQRIGMLKIRIIPPTPSPSLFKVFVHSSASPGKLDVPADGSSAAIELPSIPAGTFVEVRALMDPSLFAAASMQDGENLSSLLDNERAVTEQWRRAEQHRIEALRRRAEDIKRAFITVIVFSLFFAAFYIWFFRKFGKELDVPYYDKYERNPPGDIIPCVLPAIMSQSSVNLAEMSRSFTGTLVECARLGYLEITESEEKTLVFKTKDIHYRLTDKGAALLEGRISTDSGERSLMWFEKDVLEAVFNEAGDGRESSGKQIQKWASGRSGGKTRYLKFIKDRAKRLRKDFERDNFRLDDPVSEKARNGFIGISVLSGISFVILFALMNRNPVYVIYGLLLMPVGILLSLPLSRRTAQAAIQHKRWMAFKKFLTDFSAMKDAGPSMLPLWEHYLVFAVVFGIADKFIDNLKLLSSEYGVAVTPALWYHPAAMSGRDGAGLSGFESLESLSHSVSNLNSFSSALSSSGGTGGGFSGGGGGGGGGGGCSAG